MKSDPWQTAIPGPVLDAYFWLMDGILRFVRPAKPDRVVIDANRRYVPTWER